MTRRFSPFFWSALTLLAGLILAWRVTVWLQFEQHELTQQRFHDLVQRASDQLVRRMNIYQYGLRGLRGAVITMGEAGINRSQISRYSLSRDLTTEFTGSRGFGFIRRVTVTDEAAFIKNTRKDGNPDFKILQFAAHNGDRLVIQYIEPEEGNHEAIGLDIGSEFNRNMAAWQAIRTGQSTLTHPITLVQAAGKVNQGFILMLPVYKTINLPPTISEREQMAYGLVYTPLVTEEILADFDFRHGEFAMALFDQDDDGQVQQFYGSNSPIAPASNLVERVPLQIFGRQWLAEMKALPPFVANLNLTSPNQYGLVLVLGSITAAGLVFGFTSIQERDRAVFREKARLAAIVEGSNDAIIGLSLDGLITDWNPAAETIFGYPAKAVIGLKTIDIIVPDDLKAGAVSILQQVKAGEVPHNFNTRRKRSDGSEFDVSLTTSPIRDDKGVVTGIAKTIRDISVELANQNRIQDLNKQLERKVAERTAHLEAAVQELIDFSYLASHDLRTPLRAVDGFSTLLPRECSGISETGTEYLLRIRGAAQQMGRIIDDMTTLIGIARAEFNPEELDISHIAQQEIEKIILHEPQRIIDIQIQPDLLGQADLKLIRTLLHQLFDNAWKFTRQIPEAKIEFGREIRNSQYHYFVRDNGIGFDMRFAERIFTAFQRLPHPHNYSGTGIGLAIVQRIVRKHGGRIEGIAIPGQGATFYFTLQSFDTQDKS